MSFEPMDISSLVLSSVAIEFSIYTFIVTYTRGRKTEQMKTAMEISAKLDDSETMIFEIEDKLKK